MPPVEASSLGLRTPCRAKPACCCRDPHQSPPHVTVASLTDQDGDHKAVLRLVRGFIPVPRRRIALIRSFTALRLAFQEIFPQQRGFARTPGLLRGARLLPDARARRGGFFRHLRMVIRERGNVQRRAGCRPAARAAVQCGGALAPFQALWHKAQTRFRRRRSSGVEHTLGKGGVASSILAGGTSFLPYIKHVCAIPQDSRFANVAGTSSQIAPDSGANTGQHSCFVR